MMDMSYGSLGDTAGLEEADLPFTAVGDQLPRLSLSIFADRLGLRAELQQDALEAGLRLAASADLGALAEGGPANLGDVILVDCPLIDARVMAGLARLDVRAARSGAALVVSTSMDALDSVFACLDQSAPQILVGPSRAERLVALGHALAARSGGVNELSETDRVLLVRLAAQVNEIASRLERIRTSVVRHAEAGVTRPGAGSADPMFRFGGSPAGAEPHALPAHAVAPAPLPDPRLVRTVIRQRQLRSRFFPGDMFADPAWDILLDLTAARGELRQVSVSSVCIASGAASTTALRWIALMTEAGLLRRESDTRDRRRAFVALTDKAADAMSRYFAALGAEAAPVV